MPRNRRALVTPFLKGVLDFLCDLDVRSFKTALEQCMRGNPPGPLIIAINHINFLEVPILMAHSHPIPTSGLVQEKAWRNPFMAFLFDSYDLIPLNREGSYVHTFRTVQQMVQRGFHIVIAPEGTRSKTGVLATGKAGIVQLALITGAPILPVAHFGGEHFWGNVTHFRRTPVTFRAGRPFRFRFEGRRPDRATQDLMLTELMGQLAALLPVHQRGEYAEQALCEPHHLAFLL